MSGAGWMLVCLCAQWCGLCRDYRATFEALALPFPGASLRWLDVEDESDLVGDIEVETFPTLLVLDPAGGVRFVGPVAPYAAVAERLMGQQMSAAAAGAVAAAVDADTLLLALRLRATG